MVFICLVVLLGIFFYGQQRKVGRETQEPLRTQPQEPTKEEIIESLSAPSDSDVRGLTDEEKDQILESLSAPSQK